MKEIKIGEFVRTERGVIGRLKKQYTFGHGVTYPESQEWILDVNGIEYVANEAQYETIVKHSKQLIDLIEVKDVIKYRIDNISTTLETKGYVEGIVDISDEEMLQKIKSAKNYHILEILTKESYMANCYKVGGED